MMEQALHIADGKGGWTQISIEEMVHLKSELAAANAEIARKDEALKVARETLCEAQELVDIHSKTPRVLNALKLATEAIAVIDAAGGG